MDGEGYITIFLPNEIMFEKDWHGWLSDCKVSGLYNLNTRKIIFDFPEDFLAFKLVFDYEHEV